MSTNTPKPAPVPTPRTDQAVALNELVGGLPGELHPRFADFARTLERELLSAQQAISRKQELIRIREKQLSEAVLRSETLEMRLGSTKAALADKTDRLIAANAMANALADQIGSIEPHEHPDEQKPRAVTWHQERKNWMAEVERLKAALAEAQQDKERLDWLEASPFRHVEGDHWDTGSPYWRCQDRKDVNTIACIGPNIRAAIDAARAEREGEVK